jgi:thiamine-monophosphate kinase
VSAAARLGEFERIARYFAPLAGPGALGLKDDAAVVEPPPGRLLVLTADAIVAGVHYLADDPPDLVARKLLRVNLSDLAAMGAEPLGYLLTTALPAECDEAWLEGFAAGLAADQREFGIALLGGDSVATSGPASLSLTALGTVQPGLEMRRSGAHPGELVCISGTLGDAALGLRALRGELSLSEADRNALIDRYRVPQPRLMLGRRLSTFATAAIDVSDGLIADLGHICDTSEVGAEIEAAALPLSPPVRRAIEADGSLKALVLGGGDDYELLVAIPPEARPKLAELARELGLELTVIGRFTTGSGVHVRDEQGREVPIAASGYRHF